MRELLHPGNPPQESLLDSRILIIDDSEFNRSLLRQVFEKHHFRNIACAIDGVKALDILAAYKPQMIVLDLMMPFMDGYEFCTHLRNMPEFQDVPVLVQTALELTEGRNKIFRLGASDLVSKPINEHELMARVRIHLERFHLIARLKGYYSRITSELALAREMQDDLLPSPALIEQCHSLYGIKIAQHFETSSEMGGDMWGCQPLDENAMSLFMSDFSGHGIHAALNAFRLHTLMQEMVPIHGQHVGHYLDTLHDRLRKLLGNAQYATMFYGVIGIHTSLLHYATAATPHPIMYRSAADRFETIDGTGYPLAMVNQPEPYPEQVTAFEPGDILILYSDALTETPNARGEFLNIDMIITYLQDNQRAGVMPLDATAIRDALIDYFRAFAAGPLQDDLTLSIYQRLQN